MNTRKLIEIILNMIVILVIIFLVYANIAYYVYGRIILASVKGMSMYPLFHENDLVIIFPSEDISLGDVIVFKNDRNEYVIHRVIAIASCKEGYTVYITKGDYNMFIDSSFISIVASRVSKTCEIEDIAIVEHYKRFIENEIHNNMIRGITKDRIVGKTLSVYGMTIRITGITQIKT